MNTNEQIRLKNQVTARVLFSLAAVALNAYQCSYHFTTSSFYPHVRINHIITVERVFTFYCIRLWYLSGVHTSTRAKRVIQFAITVGEISVWSPSFHLNFYKKATGIHSSHRSEWKNEEVTVCRLCCCYWCCWPNCSYYCHVFSYVCDSDTEHSVKSVSLLSRWSPFHVHAHTPNDNWIFIIRCCLSNSLWSRVSCDSASLSARATQ